MLLELWLPDDWGAPKMLDGVASPAGEPAPKMLLAGAVGCEPPKMPPELGLLAGGLPKMLPELAALAGSGAPKMLPPPELAAPKIPPAEAVVAPKMLELEFWELCDAFDSAAKMLPNAAAAPKMLAPLQSAELHPA